MPMKRICLVVTAEFAVKAFLLNHLRALSHLYEVTVIVNTNNSEFLSQAGINAKVIPLKIAREINILSDIASLLSLVRIFRNHQFDAIHSITPKAGLLAMLAAFATKTSIRIHTFQGEVWVTKTGVMRHLLIFLDKLVAKIATDITVVSQSEKEFLVSHGIIQDKKSIVFNHGSISGVDLTRFKASQTDRIAIRQRCNIGNNEIVILYLGRLNRDKGILDLVDAFTQLDNKEAHLLIVGPDEHNLKEKILTITTRIQSNVHIYGETQEPEKFMSASDIIMLPSYREGFGVVIIEAAAIGIPAIASKIYGITDAIVENVTGLLHEPKAIPEIRSKMNMLIENPNLRLRLGENARLRAIKDFDTHVITQAWVDFYQNKFDSHVKKSI